MKFLFIAHRFHTNLYHRAKALQDAGNKVKTLVLYEGRSEYKKDLEIIKIEVSFFSQIFSMLFNFLRKGNLKPNLELRIQSPGKGLISLLKNYKPDVIILKAFQNRLAIKTLKLAKKQNIKVLMLTQTEKTEIKGSKKLFQKNINYFKRLGVFAYITPILSNYEKFKEIGIENIHYLPFVFPSQIKTEHKNTNTINILSIGKYTKRKDHLLLIKAVEQVHKNGYDIKLNIFGEKAESDYFDSLQSYVNKLPAQLIKLHENLPYEAILEEYSMHHLFVLPSFSEPAAYSPVEAMSYGLPVICSDQCGTKCYINEGKNGYFFKAKDLNDLISKIEKAISDKNRLTELSAAALNSAKEHHKPSDFAKKIKEITFGKT